MVSLENILELGDLSSSEKAERLNVRYTTTGMLWKMGEMFQLSIELYDNKESKVVWSDQWQENWDNLPTIKGNLSTGLLKALNTKKSFKDQTETISTEAYKYYLEAKFKFDNLENESEIELIRGLLTKCFSLDVNLLEAKFLLAKTYFHTDEHKKAKELSFQIIEKTEKDKNYRILAEVIGNLGLHYTLRRDFNEGLKYFNRALEISKQMNDKQAIAKSKWGLAWISVYAGVHSHDQVIDMFKSVISSFEELQDYSELIGTYTDLGYCYLHLRGQLDKSLEYFKLALKHSEDFGKENEEVSGSLGVGIYYSFIGEFAKGDSYLNNSLEGSINRGDKTGIALYSQCLGESLFCQGKYEESLACFERTINISEKTDLRLWIIGPVLGVAINRKKLGIDIDYDNIKEQIEKYYQKDNWYEYYHDYLQYLLFEDNRYLQLAYDKLNNISIKLNKKDRAKLLKCPWPKMIIAEWEKVN